MAREAIRDLVARYNAHGDAGRFDAMLELFCEDAVLEVPGERLQGRAAIRAMFERVARRTGKGAPARFVRHFTATQVIDVHGPEEAQGRCYYAVVTDRGLDHWGVYRDRYRRTEDRWRFALRRVSVDAAVPGGWAAPPPEEGAR